MARVKITPANFKSKLALWGNNQNLTDELVYLPKEGIDENEVINLGWENKVIIESVADIGQFKKFVWREKLT